MSWIEQAQDNMIIRTGDGKEYRPLWKEPKKIIEYNVAQFDFPTIHGSIVKSDTIKGRVFPMEIYFVGEDHLGECTDFEISALDKRNWRITHPYYGFLIVRPTRIEIDHSGGNVSKINLNVIETLDEENPKGVSSPSNKIIEDGAQLSDNFSTQTLVQIPTLTTADKNLLIKNVGLIYNSTKSQIKSGEDAERYLNSFNDANTAILNATNDVFTTMSKIQAMINLPFQFVDSVKNRINMLKTQFLKLAASPENIELLFSTPHSKRLYEHNAGMIIISMAQSSVTQIDYASSEDVLLTTTDLLDTYNDYIENLDTLQTATGGDDNSYIPDHGSMAGLQDLISFTASKLLEIAIDSKQERIIVLEADTNIILLTHRLYGLEPDDSTIDYLIETNKLGLNDILQLNAGKKIKYYV
jgi:hypothetical protein